MDDRVIAEVMSWCSNDVQQQRSEDGRRSPVFAGHAIRLTLKLFDTGFGWLNCLLRVMQPMRQVYLRSTLVASGELEVLDINCQMNFQHCLVGSLGRQRLFDGGSSEANLFRFV